MMLVTDELNISNFVNYSIEIKINIIHKIRNQFLLSKIALEDSNYKVKNFALEKLNDQDLLVYLSINTNDEYIRRNAISKLNTKEKLLNLLFLRFRSIW